MPSAASPASELVIHARQYDLFGWAIRTAGAPPSNGNFHNPRSTVRSRSGMHAPRSRSCRPRKYWSAGSAYTGNASSSIWSWPYLARFPRHPSYRSRVEGFAGTGHPPLPAPRPVSIYRTCTSQADFRSWPCPALLSHSWLETVYSAWSRTARLNTLVAQSASGCHQRRWWRGNGDLFLAR